MDSQRLIRISKYLSKHLRHTPHKLGLTLAPGGWVEVAALLSACRHHQFPITPAELDEVVAQNDKQRFSFDPSRTRIRANQGHSVDVDLQLTSLEPPPTLYHGTGQKSVESILEQGISRMNRQHVHLSADVETALKVGARHGKPVILEVNTGQMHRDGHLFFRSDNGVWLVDQVPPVYLKVLERDPG